MANIVIKDLTENVELDRKAMRSITGGNSGPRTGVPSYHSSFFQKPMTFNELKLIPGDVGLRNPQW